MLGTIVDGDDLLKKLGLEIMMMMMIDVYRHFYVHGRQKWAERPSNVKGNEAKSKMKHSSDMSTPRFELRW